MIERRQLTRYQQDRMGPADPSPYDPEYFECEMVSTGMSSAVCTYGYSEITKTDEVTSRVGPWLKIKDAKDAMLRARSAP